MKGLPGTEGVLYFLLSCLHNSWEQHWSYFIFTLLIFRIRPLICHFLVIYSTQGEQWFCKGGGWTLCHRHKDLNLAWFYHSWARQAWLSQFRYEWMSIHLRVLDLEKWLHWANWPWKRTRVLSGPGLPNPQMMGLSHGTLYHWFPNCEEKQWWKRRTQTK